MGRLSGARVLSRNAGMGACAVGRAAVKRSDDCVCESAVSFTFRPAVRENVGLLIGLIAPSGGGKTYTAMRLATGIAGDKRFCVIDTEAGRAKHYADQFAFDHGDL